MHETILELVRNNDICVLATTSGDTPHCSLMAYTADEECREIYMVTFRNSRKYRNLTGNPRVSLLVDTREEHAGAHRAEVRALTIAGLCRRIEDPRKKETVRELLLGRHPHLQPFLDSPEGEIICITVSSFLLLNGPTESHFEEI